MTRGFNVGLGVASSEVLTYGGEMPRSKGGVKRLLFSDSVTEIVKGGVRNSVVVPLDVSLLSFNGRMHIKLGQERYRGLHLNSGM